MLHFIDFEVFAHDWLCVIISPTHKTKKVIVNDREKLEAYFKRYKYETFVGYNIRHYDQFIFKGILLGFNPKDVNDWIIVKDRMGWQYSDLFRNVDLIFYDAKPEDGNSPGLKKLEGFLGNDIRESKVDFRITRKLTTPEIAETIKYCTHDVEQTIQVFMHNKDDYYSHLDIVDTFDLPMLALGKTQTQKAAMVMGAVKQKRDDEFDIEFPETLQLQKYKYVAAWYLDPANRYKRKADGKVDKKSVKKLECIIAGVPHDFGWGGLHGAKKNYVDTGLFLNMDVASYYPSLKIRYKWYSRNIKNPATYQRIYDTRQALKAQKDPKQAPYKLVLNKGYGAMKDKHNALFDPRQANNVCIGGQLLLLDLIEKLEPYCDIVQSNTDGILVKLRNNREQVEKIAGEWMTRTGMVLEFEEYVKVIQKDVNNYILVPSGSLYDEKGKPRWKSKGAMVKKQNKLDYNLPIVNEAVTQYLLRGTPVEETINGCHELIKFQQIVSVSKKYEYAMHGLERLNESTLRVFASKELTDGGVFKVKAGGNPEKFENTSLNCFIDNSNVNGKPVPEKLDRDFYINMARSQVNQFIGKE